MKIDYKGYLKSEIKEHSEANKTFKKLLRKSKIDKTSRSTLDSVTEKNRMYLSLLHYELNSLSDINYLPYKNKANANPWYIKQNSKYDELHNEKLKTAFEINDVEIVIVIDDEIADVDIKSKIFYKKSLFDDDKYVLLLTVRVNKSSGKIYDEQTIESMIPSNLFTKTVIDKQPDPENDIYGFIAESLQFLNFM